MAGTRNLVFIVVAYNGHRLFFHEESKRATAELGAARLPLGSKVSLRRGEETVSTGQTTLDMTGDRSYFAAFTGTPPLVRCTRETDREAVSAGVLSSQRDKVVLTLRARSAGLRLGDVLEVELGPKDEKDTERGNWDANQWLEISTESSRAVAVKWHVARQIEAKIYRMLGEDRAYKFFERHDKKKPEEQLRLAKKLVAERKRRRAKR